MNGAQSESPNTNGDSTVGMFRQMATKRAGRQRTTPDARRRLALVAGLVLGLAYGITSQTINALYEPTLPFSHRPLGMFGNAALIVVVVVLICYLCSLLDAWRWSAGLAAVTLVLILELRAVLTGGRLVLDLVRFAHPIWPILAIALEMTVLFPLMLVLRWAIEIQAENAMRPLLSSARLRPLALFLVVGIGLGYAWLYSPLARSTMHAMKSLIEEGLSAPDASGLPQALSSSAVGDFKLNATGAYTLELGDAQLVDPGYVQDPEVEFPPERVMIIARFRSGWTLMCLYVEGEEVPLCKGLARALPPSDFRVI